MPKYELSAPDGDSLVIEADAAPSDSDIQEIFQSRKVSKLGEQFKNVKDEGVFQPTELSPTTEFAQAIYGKEGLLRRDIPAGIDKGISTVMQEYLAAPAEASALIRGEDVSDARKEALRAAEQVIERPVIEPPPEDLQGKGVGPSLRRFGYGLLTPKSEATLLAAPESTAVKIAFGTQAGSEALNAAEEFIKATDSQERLGAATDFFLNAGMGALMAHGAARDAVKKTTVFEQRMGRKPTPEEAKQILSGHIELPEVEPSPTQAMPKETAPPLAAEIKSPGETPPSAPAPDTTMAENDLIAKELNRPKERGQTWPAWWEETQKEVSADKIEAAVQKHAGRLFNAIDPKPLAPVSPDLVSRAMQLLQTVKPGRDLEAQVAKNILEARAGRPEKLQSNINELEILSKGGKVIRPELGDYSVLDAVKESGGLGGPSLDTALERMGKGEPAAKISAEFGGDYDSVAPILEQIFEARRNKNWTEYNRLKKAYTDAGLGSGGKIIDKTLGAISALPQEGFGAFKPKNADDLISTAWKTALEKGEKKPTEAPQQLSKDEKFAVATSEKPGATPKTAESFSIGDAFEVAGQKFEVTAIDPDTGNVTVKDGRKFGQQILKEGQSPVWVEKFESKGEGDFETGAIQAGIDRDRQRIKDIEKEIESLKAKRPKATTEKEAWLEGDPFSKGQTSWDSALEQKIAQLEQEAYGLEATLPKAEKEPALPITRGAANPVEFEPPQGSATGIKNARVDAERQRRGQPPTMAPLRQENAVLWDRVMARIDREPAWQDSLVEELLENPRAVNEEELLAVQHRYVDLQNEYDRATQQVAQAYENQPDLVPEMQDQVAYWSDRLSQFEDMTRKVGSIWGRTGQLRQRLFNRDFSLANMESQWRAARNGEPLSNAERAEMQDTFRRYTELQKSSQEAEAAWRQRISELETERNIAQQRAAAFPSLDQRVLEAAQRIVDAAKTRADAARERIISRRREGRLFIGIDPTEMVDYAEIGAAKIMELSLDIARFTDEMVRDLGEQIRPFMQQIWDASQQLVTRNTRESSDQVRRVFRARGRNLQNIIEQTGDAIQATVQRGELDGMFPLVQRLVRAIVERSMNISRDALVDEVWDILKASLPEITRRDAMDAISGYGRFQPLRKDDLSVRLRDLKGQLQQVAKIEDLTERQPPRKTGLERREPSDEERRLIQLVNEAKRRYGVRITDPETQLKSVLDARKTALRNQISDLDYQIRTQQRIVREKTPPPSDSELESLRTRRNELKQQFDAVFGSRELTDAQRAQREAARLDREIAEVERQLREGDIFTEKKKAPELSTPEIEARRARLDALKSERDYLRESINPKPRLTPEQKVLKAYEARLKREIADKTDRMARGDFTPKPKRPLPEKPQSLRALEAQTIKVRKDFEKRVAIERLKNRTPGQKLRETIVKWRQTFAISGIKSLAKLITASVEGTVILTLREAAGAGLSKLPILSDIAKKADRESGSSIAIETKAHAEAWRMFLEDFSKNIRGQKPDFEQIYGGRENVPPELENYVGFLHSAEKGLLARNEWVRAYAILREKAAKMGLDVADPAVDMALGFKAWESSQFWKFQNRNIVASLFRQSMRRLESVKGMKGDVAKTGAFAARIAAPIVTVPTNIVARVLESIYGVPVGVGRLGAHALKYAIKNKTLRGAVEALTPEEADLIMGNFKTGSIGLGFALIGYFNPNNFGGYYQPGQKRGKDEAKFGAVKVAGLNIPSFILHNPFLEAAQFGASIRRVMNSRLKKKDQETRGFARGVVSATMSAVGEQPFVREATDLTKLLSDRERENFAGQELKSIVIPQAVQNVAEWMDKNSQGEAIKRKPETIPQHLKTGIPGLRKTVPEASAARGR